MHDHYLCHIGTCIPTNFLVELAGVSDLGQVNAGNFKIIDEIYLLLDARQSLLHVISEKSDYVFRTFVALYHLT